MPRSGCSALHEQHCVLVMTEKWQKRLEKGGISEVILTDL